MPPFVGDPGDIKGADAKIREKSGDSNLRTRHMSPIWQQGNKFWETLKEKIIKSGPFEIKSKPSVHETLKGIEGNWFEKK